VGLRWKGKKEDSAVNDGRRGVNCGGEGGAEGVLAQHCTRRESGCLVQLDQAPPVL
jgi:hypothetical protein